MACRSTERGEGAADDVRREVSGADLRVAELDLADLASVRAFADGLDGEVDVLVNNAGVMAVPYGETTDGFETQFGVNHLGHFALTGLLRDRVTDRVVTVSSGLHERGDPERTVARAGPGDPTGYDRWDAYADSKLANLLFAFELDRRFEAADAGVDSLGCHPGWAATALQSGAASNPVERVGMRLGNALLAQSAAAGALPTLYAAVGPAEGGDYVGPGGLMDMRGAPERQRASRAAYDRDAAARLWERSAEVTGVGYDLPAEAPA
jgi:NAD(P)-dependent dehydrogenase (short-subunit alcohol dehydrogenase family)